MNRQLLREFINLLLLISSLYADARLVSPADTFRLMDARNGLPESRVRRIVRLPYVKMSIATAGAVAVYDGNGFHYIMTDPSTYCYLDDYDSYRHLLGDFGNRIWIEYGHELSVFYSVSDGKSPLSMPKTYSSYCHIGKIDVQPIDSPDKIFIDKFRKLVEEHISNPDLSVQLLSDMMSMERTVLYRKLQYVTKTSPS